MKAALTEALGTSTDCEFTIDPGLISGISLQVNGYKIAWNVADYLTAFEKSVSASKPIVPKKDLEKKLHAVN